MTRIRDLKHCGITWHRSCFVLSRLRNVILALPLYCEAETYISKMVTNSSTMIHFRFLKRIEPYAHQYLSILRIKGSSTRCFMIFRQLLKTLFLLNTTLRCASCLPAGTWPPWEANLYAHPGINALVSFCESSLVLPRPQYKYVMTLQYNHVNSVLLHTVHESEALCCVNTKKKSKRYYIDSSGQELHMYTNK